MASRKLFGAALEELGFAPEILPVAFAEAAGVDNVDSFVKQNRVAIFAKRVRVPNAATEGRVAPAQLAVKR